MYWIGEYKSKIDSKIWWASSRRPCQKGLLKILNLKYEVLQLDISNFKSTRWLILEKDKAFQTW